MVGLLEALPQDILTYMVSPPSEEEMRREGIHELAMAHARNLKGLKGLPSIQMALFERIKFDGVSVKFCELALSAFNLGIQRGMAVDEIAEGVRICPRNACDPAQFLPAFTAQGESLTAESAIEQDPECVYLLGRMSEKLRVKARFEKGNLILALQDNPTLFKEIARRLVGPEGKR